MEEMMIAQGIEAWYRANTLTERLPSLHLPAQQSPSCSNELARQKLQRWKEQTPFHKEGHFARRLAADGLTEDDLLQLLAGTGVPPEAPWMALLQQVFERRNSHDEVVLPVLLGSENAPISLFIEILKPLLNDPLQRLRAGAQALLQQYEAAPFELEAAMSLLLACVGTRLLPKIMKTVVLELNVARMQGRLQGETSEERYLHFLHYLSREGIWPLLEEYPVLARLLVEMIENWVARSLELLQRLCADWQEIRATFLSAGENDPGMLVEIQTGRGDSHRSGSSVTILTWSSGFQLVYKPRSLGIDEHFHDLLYWLNEQGYEPAFRPFKLINKKSYGWVEFIQPASCTSPQEIERFYQRQGGYLAVLYALGAVDFHAENLIASGEYPILIDLEAFFHPRMAVPKTVAQSYPGLDIIDHSVLVIGMLPQRLWSSENVDGIDYSAMGYQAGQMSPLALPTLAAFGTDEMRFSRERGELVMEGNPRPQLNGGDVDLLTYCPDIIKGFTTIYHLLLRHRATLLNDLLPRFMDDEIRCLMRPTQIYKFLLADTVHPDALRDAMDRQRILDRLWVGTDRRPHLERVIAAESADLCVGDVPVFTSYPGSRNLYTSSGEEMENFFDETGLDMARRGLSRFSEQDLEKQVWIIRASFTSMVLGVDKPSQNLLKLRPTDAEVSRERLLEAACAVGDRLCALALYGEDVVGWLGVAPVNEREWHLQSADLDLYSGVSGIALFLAYLGKITGESKYTELVKLALNSVRKQVQVQVERERLNISAFNGMGSFIYLLSHLGTLWHEPALYQEAASLVEALPDLIPNDELFDVINGSAGCISALLSLHSVAPSITTLIAALQCGDHLLAHAKPCQIGLGWSTKQQEIPLLGFSHGNAGIALNLLRLFLVSGEERFYQTALDAIAYERSQFSAEQRNWPDLRSEAVAKLGNPDQRAFMVGWCHGAPGVGLARLGTLQLIDSQEIRAEIANALQTTIEHGFGNNHSLCHGDLGNLDVLLTASSLLDEPHYVQQVQRFAAMQLASIEEQGWITGVPQGVETPGLMTGLAGIGYALLRLAAVEQVPSVLLLDPPLPSC